MTKNMYKQINFSGNFLHECKRKHQIYLDFFFHHVEKIVRGKKIYSTMYVGTNLLSFDHLEIFYSPCNRDRKIHSFGNFKSFVNRLYNLHTYCIGVA